jgi:hypothetical protein
VQDVAPLRIGSEHWLQRSPSSLSPSPRQSCHRGGERVIKQASSNIAYQTLTQSNYTEWSLIMMVNLQAAEL